MLTTTNAYPDGSTNANFRAWGQAIGTGLSNAGLSKTSDTGQINWSTVTSPSGGYGGYEIWKFTDSLQATVPVLFRIDYGNDGGNAPEIMVQCGDSTDGAGNLVGGQISGQVTFPINVGSATVQSQIAVSASTNRVVVGLFITNRTTINHQPVIFSIERDKDATGTDTNLGFYFMAITSTGVRGTQFIPKASIGVPQTMIENICLYPASRGTGQYGTNIGLFPYFPTLGWVLNPSSQVFGFFTSDLAENTLITFSVYGANHNFYTVEGIGIGSLGNAIRYD